MIPTAVHRAAILLVFVLLVPSQTALAQMIAGVYASGFSAPVAFVQDPSDASVQYVVEQAGIIRVIENRVVQSIPFLNISHLIAAGGERGLLGLAFPGDDAASGRFYVSFTRAGDGHTVIARFRRSANPLVADPDSYFPLVWSADPNAGPDELDAVPQPFIPQPFANHNGGCIAFGPDGFLYVARGDGGSGDDPLRQSQDPTELLGKILRIDVSVPDGHPTGFVVPGGNAGLPRPEIWSLGLRNPWKFSFDDPSKGGTGAMLIADVGQGAIEEIDYEPALRAGRNYGWPHFEGTRTNIDSAPLSSSPTSPLFEYDRSGGRSVTGGYVYRGASMPEMIGRYVFGDYVSGRVWSLQFAVSPSTGEATPIALVDHTADLGGGDMLGNISGFGVDSAGELYVINHTGGSIVRLMRSAPPPAPGGVRIIKK